MSFTSVYNMNNKELQFDRDHIWHPYTSTIKPLTCYPVVSASGVYLTLSDGRKLIEGTSSWWAAAHGYNNKKLNAALESQVKKMAHVMFAGITHPSAISVCQKLLAIAPANLDKVFLSDSGSVAVEVALKMALQYWSAQGEIRSKFLTIRNGYHGDTFAAMSVTDPQNSMHSLYQGFLPEHIFADAPKVGFNQSWNERDIDDFAKQLALNSDEIAAVILEPIVQGAGGMNFYHPNYLKAVRNLCNQYNVLLICDEIATGFGRTGKLFACEHASIEPDIMCVGKALTGGYMTLAATLTTKHVADTVCSGSAGCFMHGPTFMGNPLATAVASASLDIIMEGKWQEQVANIEHIFAEKLPPLLKHANVKDIRWLGAIGVVETYKKVDQEPTQALLVANGVWIRPFGNLIYIMPAYIITTAELEKIIATIDILLGEPNCFLS